MKVYFSNSAFYLLKTHLNNLNTFDTYCHIFSRTRIDYKYKTDRVSLSKTDLRSETRIRWFRPLSDSTFEIGWVESRPEIWIDLNRTISDPNEVAYFTWQVYWTKNRLTRGWLNWSSLDQHRTDPKYYLIQDMIRLKSNLIHINIEWSIYLI